MSFPRFMLRFCLFLIFLLIFTVGYPNPTIPVSAVWCIVILLALAAGIWEAIEAD